MLAAYALAAGGSSAEIPACTGPQLTGTFAVVPNSAGAGNIVYRLRLRNRSTKTCFVSGLPRLRLLGRTGRALPTNVAAVHSGQLTAVRIVLKPGDRAHAFARFSPDIPGPGEPVTGKQCEPTSYKVRVTAPPGGGTLVAPVSPPTPVCEHGGMSLTVLSGGA